MYVFLSLRFACFLDPQSDAQRENQSLFLPFILLWKGVRVFPLSTVIPSCQIRETARCLSLAECARLFLRGDASAFTSFPNVPSRTSPPPQPFYVALA